MLNTIIVCRVIVLCSVLAFANAARCVRTANGIVCEKVNRGAIERLGNNYKNDASLIVNNSVVPVLRTGMFERLKFVQKLSLTSCGIEVLEDNVFRGLNLTHLSLAKNLIKNISQNVFVGLTDLKFFDLSHNVITRLELSTSVNYLPKLICLDVSNNRLKQLNLIGNFSELETINVENNTLKEVQTSEILNFPKVKEVFFAGNIFNKTYENLVKYVLMSSNIEINFKNSSFDDEWNSADDAKRIPKNMTSIENNVTRSLEKNIATEFKLSPDLIKSLSPLDLNNLVQRILTLRNFTLHEKNMLEMERKRIQDESRSVKNELMRIDEVIKRHNEVARIANDETVGEYIEKSCKGMPEDSWWQRFRKWKCKKLLNWVRSLISR